MPQFIRTSATLCAALLLSASDRPIAASRTYSGIIRTPWDVDVVTVAITGSTAEQTRSFRAVPSAVPLQAFTSNVNRVSFAEIFDGAKVTCTADRSDDQLATDRARAPCIVKLVRTEDFPSADRLIGAYQAATGALISITRLDSGDLSLVDYQLSLQRTLYYRGQSTFTFGRGTFDPLPIAGSITVDGEGRAASLRYAHDLPQSLVRLHFAERTIRWSDGNASLEGTLILPAGDGPFPAVILTQWAGPTPRDGYRVFANWFVSKGIAALVYDRRGVGRSRGDTSTTGFPELAQDAANAATALKQIPNIDPNRIGVWGQSQGGWIAPLAAARSRDISWVIAQSGPAVTASEQDVFRTEHQAIAEGLTQQEVREATHYIRLVDRWRNEGVGREQVITAAKQAQGKRWASLVPLYDERIPDHIPEGRRDKFWLFDPLPDYSRVRVPILILYGDKDAYVPITKSVALWRRAISKSGNRSARIVVLHNATHSYWVGRHDGLADLAESPGFHPDYWPTLDRFLQQYVLHRKGGLPAQTSRNHSLTSASDASYWEEWAESCHWDRSSTEHLLQFVQKRLIYPSALACLS